MRTASPESSFQRAVHAAAAALLLAAACGPRDHDPCEDVVCEEPPAATCVGPSAVTHEATGTCIAGTCTYEQVWTDCPSEGRVCEGGACVETDTDLCADVVCDEPPDPTCDGDEAVTYATSLGTCDPADGTCSYAETGRTDCAAEGRFCANGACVDADPCEDVTCDDPPATRCREGNVEIFEETGACFGGLCTYYVAERLFCADDELACDAEGEECVDLCDGVVCNDPPPPHCDGFVRVAFAETGECAWEDGACTYAEVRTDCALAQQVCEGDPAACVDPCDGVVCDDVPSAQCCDEPPIHPETTCDDPGEIAVHYVGECAWYEGGDCVYTPVPTNCPQQGQTCAGGTCVD